MKYDFQVLFVFDTLYSEVMNKRLFFLLSEFFWKVFFLFFDILNNWNLVKVKEYSFYLQFQCMKQNTARREKKNCENFFFWKKDFNKFPEDISHRENCDDFFCLCLSQLFNRLQIFFDQGMQTFSLFLIIWKSMILS